MSNASNHCFKGSISVTIILEVLAKYEMLPYGLDKENLKCNKIQSMW